MGLSGVIGKFVQVPAVMVTWGRVFCSTLVLLILVLWKREPLRLKGKKQYVLAILGGLVVALHWTAFFQSIQLSTVAIGLITFSTFPFFLTFLEPLIYKEKIQIKNILVSLLLLFGVGVTIPDFSLDTQEIVGIIWGMISSFTYAILALINRFLAKDHTGKIICIYQHGTAFLILLPVALFSSVTWSTADVVGIGVNGLVCTALAFTLFVTAQRYIKAQIVGLVTGLETVYGIVFAALLLREIPSMQELMGAVIIIAVAVYSSARLKN